MSNVTDCGTGQTYLWVCAKLSALKLGWENAIRGRLISMIKQKQSRNAFEISICTPAHIFDIALFTIFSFRALCIIRNWVHI